MRRFQTALRARDPDESHRAATTLELLFDLVSVVAIAAVTASFHHAISEGHGAEAFPRFLFLFLAIWWAWMNFTWFASAFDNDDVVYRILVMVIMSGELLFAGGASKIFETLDFGFGLLGWIVMRLAMIGLWLRAAHANPEYRRTAMTYAVGIAVAQLSWCVLYFSTQPASAAFYTIGVLCFLVEWCVPPIAERQKVTPFHRHHIIERYGLLMIISLGEIVLSISQGYGQLFTDHPNYQAAAVSTATLVIIFSMWWVYFYEEEHLPNRNFTTAFAWGYGHVFVFMATAGLGATIAASIDVELHRGHATQAYVSGFLGTSLAVFALSLWFVRDLSLHLPAKVRYALPAMALLFLAAGLAGLSIKVLAVLCVVMVAWRTAGNAKD
ncbi:MAG: low temperature requirement protein A [Nitratireductor sp.]